MATKKKVQRTRGKGKPTKRPALRVPAESRAKQVAPPRETQPLEAALHRLRSAAETIPRLEERDQPAALHALAAFIRGNVPATPSVADPNLAAKLERALSNAFAKAFADSVRDLSENDFAKLAAQRVRRLPPKKGPHRASRVRSLVETAAMLARVCEFDRLKRDHELMGDLERAVVGEVHRLLLAPPNGNAKQFGWLLRKCRESQRVDSERVASWAMQACGISAKTADNWISAAVKHSS